MTFQDIDYKNPLKGFHSSSKIYGGDNSMGTFDIIMNYDPKIVEVDLRKSRDGILYCYHGMEPFCRFLKFFKFSAIKKLLNKDTLKKVLETISNKDKPIIFVDIKQGNISIEDLDKICLKFDFNYLLQFSTSKNAKVAKLKIKNQPYKVNWYCPFGFYPFLLRFWKAKKYNLDMFELFWNECTDENIKKVHRAGMIHDIRDRRLRIFRVNSNKYKELIRKYGIPFFLFNDLDNLTHMRVSVLDVNKDL